MEAPAFASADLKADLIRLLASGDLCSKRWIYEQYDYMVRTNTLAGPGGDAAVVRVKETGTSVAMSLDGNGRYCYLDPREGAKLVVAEACRNVSTVGALPVAATNNLNFGNPQRPEIMAQLVEAIEGMAEACLHFETPITGGNVSLYNETLGEGILPTPVIGIVGLLPTQAPVPSRFRAAGRTVMLLGGVGATDEVHFGGTQYAHVLLGQMWGLPPALDMALEKRVQAAIREMVAAGVVDSAHDLSDGGFAVGLAEASFDGVGAAVTLPASALRPELLLFHEGPSRILLSTNSPEEVTKLADKHGVPAVAIGATVPGQVVIEGYLSATVEELHQPWAKALESALNG
jgi:phosphoribosylformylglycinamidine synthase